MIQPGDKIRILTKCLSGAQVDVGDVLIVSEIFYPITNTFSACSSIGPYANIEWSFMLEDLGKGFMVMPQGLFNPEGECIDTGPPKNKVIPTRTSTIERDKCRCDWTVVYQKGCQCGGC